MKQHPATPHQRTKAQFTQELIKALEDAAKQRDSRTPEALARACWDALQWDLPAVEERELKALLDAFRLAVQGQGAPPPYQLTAKFVANVASGARRAVSEPAAAAPPASPSAAAANGAAAAAAAPLAALYQQLHGVIALQCMAAALRLSHAQAWKLLLSFAPPEPTPPPACAAPANDGEDAAAAAPPPPLDCDLTVEAARPDVDGEAYEDMWDALPPPKPHTTTASHATRAGSRGGSSRGAAAPPASASYSWPALRERLLALGAAVASYPPMACREVWEPPGGTGAAQLLRLVRALRAHARAAELHPLLEAYVGVAVERVAAAPGDLPLMGQLWEALGVAGTSAGAGDGGGDGAAADEWCRPRGPGGRRGPLGAEACLVLESALALARRLPAGPHQRALWRLAHARLLPPLARSCEALAYAKPPPPPPRGATDAHAQEWEAAAAAGRCLVGELTEWLVHAAPKAHDPGEALIASGAMRGLAALFVAHAPPPGEEPVRRAALLAAAASPAASRWAAAVPGLAALVLQGPAFGVGGALEAHGAVWGLLLGGQTGGVVLAAVADASAAAAVDAQQLARLHAALALLTDARAAARGRALWSPAVDAGLRRLYATLRSNSTPPMARDDAAQQEGVEAGTEEGGEKAHVPSPAQLLDRRERRLKAACCQLLKALLTQGGKSD